MNAEQGLAYLARAVLREGDGANLDGRDVEGVVARLEGKLAGSATKRTKGLRSRSKKAQAEPRLRDVPIPPPDDRQPVLDGKDLGFRRFVAELACSVELIAPPTGLDPAHWLAKRRHRDWVVIDQVLQGNVFPLQRRHHTGQHDGGILTWAARHGIDLANVCRNVGRGYLDGWSPEALSEEARRSGGYQHIDFANARTPKNGGMPF